MPRRTKEPVQLPSIEVPNTPGLVSTIDSNAGPREYSGQFIVAGFGETVGAKPSHLSLSATHTIQSIGNPPTVKTGNGTLIVDKFDKFNLRVTREGNCVLQSKNGSTLKLLGVERIFSKGDDGSIDLNPHYDRNGQEVQTIIPRGQSRNLAAIDRIINAGDVTEPTDQSRYVGGTGNDYFSLSGYASQNTRSKNVTIVGGAGEDTVYLDWVSKFTVTNKGDGNFEIRAKNGATVKLSGVELIHNSGEHDDIGKLSDVPRNKTVPLSSIMKSQ